MSGTLRAGRYRSLFEDRRLARVFVLAMVGRFGYAVLPLCLLFTISDATQSFSVAAAATAVFGVSGLVMPAQARLLDRYGQSRVLPLVGGLFTAFLVTVASMGALGMTSRVGWVTICLSGGLCAPSLGPSMRAQWREATSDHDRRAAYSVDAIAEETVFFLGPLVASGMFLIGPAWHGVGLAAVLIAAGVGGLAASPFAPAPAHSSPSHQAPANALGPLRSAGFRRLLLVMFLAGAAPSAAMTCVAAMSNEAGHPSVTGIVEVAAGMASLLGGWLWGMRRASPRWQSELAALLAVRAPLMMACAALPTLWFVSVLVALTGLVMAPTYIVGFNASDHEAESEHHTEASTWVSALNNIGISVGTGIAGWLFAALGVPVLFSAVAAALVAAAVVAGVAPSRDGGEAPRQ